MGPDEISEIVRSIEQATNKSELDIIVTAILQMPSEEREQIDEALASLGAQAEERKLGQPPVGDAAGDVGTPSGNRSYVILRIK